MFFKVADFSPKNMFGNKKNRHRFCYQFMDLKIAELKPGFGGGKNFSGPNLQATRKAIFTSLMHATNEFDLKKSQAK